MKIKDVEGNDCEAVVLPAVDAVSVEISFGQFCPAVEPEEFGKRGSVFIIQGALDKAYYRKFVKMVKDAGSELQFPPVADVAENTGLVLAHADYRITKNKYGEPVMKFSHYEPIDRQITLGRNGQLGFVDGDEPEETVEEMRKHWRDFLIEIPEPPKKASDEIFLTLAYRFYDAIEAGEKTTEYRDYTENWVKKLLTHPIRRVKFQRGYGGSGHDEPRQMTWEVAKISLYDSETGEKGDPLNPPAGILPDAIAIDLGKRLV